MWSTSYRNGLGTALPKYKVEGIFTEEGRYWLTKDWYTGHGFTIKLSGCKISVVGVRVKNIAHVYETFRTRATRSFRVSGVLTDSGPWNPWEQLLEEEFENPLPAGAPAPSLQTFYFREAVEVQFLRFDLDSYWGDIGGGLEFFDVITVSGNFCSVLVYPCVSEQSCANPLRWWTTAHPMTADPLLPSLRNIPVSSASAGTSAQVKSTD